MAVENANVFDIQKALNPDGSPVDIHRVVAARMFGVPYDSVVDSQRKAAKAALYKHLYTNNGGAIHVR